jgi:hypothetical protein
MKEMVRSEVVATTQLCNNVNKTMWICSPRHIHDLWSPVMIQTRIRD